MAETASASADSTAEKYDKSHGQMDRGRQVAGDLAPHLVDGPVLEVGVGTGLVAAALRELGHDVRGIDNNEEMLTGARERLGDAVSFGDALDLPVEDGSMANVVYVHVLHLLDDLPAGLAEAARVLRPGGRLVAIHGVPIADPDDMTAAVAPLDPYMGLADEADRLDPLAAAAGFRLLSRESASPFTGGMTPEEYAQSIESRMWSFLTGLDDETWARVVEPSIAALRALPEPDRPREQTWRVNLAVLTTGD